MIVMKRLCIYLTYDSKNIIDRYVTYMLRELRACCTRLLLVCNSRADWQDEDVGFYAEQVVYRDNVGYDAGGYKDVLCEYIGWDGLREYDELILVNDSFYGPLYPMQQIFDVMNVVQADFWGLTRSRAGMTDKGIQYDEHIQSYFLVFRRKVVETGVFREFWEKMIYPETLEAAVRNFEMGINTWLKQNGFQGAAVSDLYSEILSPEENENPYMVYPLGLIRDCRIPILKCKALFFGNSGYADALKAFQFIEENRLYPTEYIKEHIRRKSKTEEGWLDYEKLERFYESHQRIFIYGFGIYGKNLGLYFRYKGWKPEGFLVTGTEENSGGATSFEQVRLEKDDGIVVAVAKKEMCMEIQEYLVGQCKEEQILFPNF